MQLVFNRPVLGGEEITVADEAPVGLTPAAFQRFVKDQGRYMARAAIITADDPVLVSFTRENHGHLLPKGGVVQIESDTYMTQVRFALPPTAKRPVVLCVTYFQ